MENVGFARHQLCPDLIRYLGRRPFLYDLAILIDKLQDCSLDGLAGIILCLRRFCFLFLCMGMAKKNR